jgi:hypothetical protein
MILAINYDLNNPGQNYPKIEDAIIVISTDYVRPLKSCWFVDTNMPLDFVSQYLHSQIDSNDRIIISEVDLNNTRGYLDLPLVKWFDSKM